MVKIFEFLLEILTKKRGSQEATKSIVITVNITVINVKDK